MRLVGYADGLFSVTPVALADVADGHMPDSTTGCDHFEVWFAQDGLEISPTALFVETDGYYDGPDTLMVDGATYTSGLGKEDLEAIRSFYSRLPEATRLSVEIALRYYLEFDAFLDPDQLGVGGYAEWGGPPAQRTPEQFLERWRTP